MLPVGIAGAALRLRPGGLALLRQQRWWSSSSSSWRCYSTGRLLSHTPIQHPPPTPPWPAAATPATAGPPLTGPQWSGRKTSNAAVEVDVAAVAKDDDEEDDEADERAAALEIKDPLLIFQTVWHNLERKYGADYMTFPKDIMWLAGAPGAGKGVMTPFISQQRGICAPPIETSALLTSPEFTDLKKAGILVGDRQVVEIMFETLLRPEYRQGCIVDGFPRTPAQAECIKLLFDKLMEQRRELHNFNEVFRRPQFHITVLFIEEEESVRRQLQRGIEVMEHNRVVQQTGIGHIENLRPTDVNADLARARYRQFKEQVYESLKICQQKFHFHFIHADGTKEEVQARIQRELEYQSAMELGDDTYELVRRVPLASEITRNARFNLVRRLDTYQARNGDMFETVIEVLESEFFRIIRQQALAGEAIIRSQTPVFTNPIGLSIALDVLSERGYTVLLDYQKIQVPYLIDVANSTIINNTERVFQFHIRWKAPKIR